MVLDEKEALGGGESVSWDGLVIITISVAVYPVVYVDEDQWDR